MAEFIELGNVEENAVAIRAEEIAYISIVPKRSFDTQYGLEYWLKGNSQVFKMTFDSVEARAQIYNSILTILKQQ